MTFVKKIKSKSYSIFIRLMLLTAFFAMVSHSCKKPAPRSGEVPVARVNEVFLYKSDLLLVVPQNISAADSALMVERFIDFWVKQQVFLQEAIKNLSAENSDFEKQIEEYRKSLTIFSYENQLVKELLDTVVTDRQLTDYYEKHKTDFRLRENIAMVNYVKLPIDAPNINQFRRLFRSNDPDEAGLIEDYCIQHAATYFIDTGSWLIFDDLLREIPLQVSNAENYLRNNKIVELTDENFRYFINFIDYQLKGSISPLAFERENIKNIILNRRKHELINKKRNQFFQEALSNKQVEISPK